MQYASTSKRSLPLKRMPTGCSKIAALWCGLRVSVDSWSGKSGREAGVVAADENDDGDEEVVVGALGVAVSVMACAVG